MDGFEVVRRLQADAMPMVVFVTAFDHYALEAFEVHAVDYVLKPVDEDRLVVYYLDDSGTAVGVLAWGVEDAMDAAHAMAPWARLALESAIKARKPVAKQSSSAPKTKAKPAADGPRATAPRKKPSRG